MDSGTTILEVAKALRNKRNLTVITNDMRIASELVTFTAHQVYFIGGLLKKDDEITGGFLALDFLKNFNHIDYAVLTADGFIVPNGGIADFNIDMRALKVAMIERAHRVLVSVDHSKFTLDALYKVCDIDKLDMVFTGSSAPQESIDILRERGVECVLVDC